MRMLPCLAKVVAIGTFGIAFAGATLAQSTTSSVDVRKFEVISADGDSLVVRDERGTSEITVPHEFRFNVDGKSLPVSELKPGMKGTATVTTKTTVTPVTVTEVRQAEVLRVSDMSVTIRGPDGVSRRFTRADINGRNIQLVMDGKTIHPRDLHKGDKLTAVVVTELPPAVLTEKEVQAVLDESKPEPVAAAAPATPAPEQPAAAPAASTQPATPTPAAFTQPLSPATPAPAPMTEAPKPEASGLGAMWWLVIAIVIGAVVFLVMRGKKAA